MGKALLRMLTYHSGPVCISACRGRTGSGPGSCGQDWALLLSPWKPSSVSSKKGPSWRAGLWTPRPSCSFHPTLHLYHFTLFIDFVFKAGAAVALLS